jgi:CRP/FNR family cyclic AMP-dependent transcriptional regulator
MAVARREPSELEAETRRLGLQLLRPSRGDRPAAQRATWLDRMFVTLMRDEAFRVQALRFVPREHSLDHQVAIDVEEVALVGTQTGCHLWILAPRDRLVPSVDVAAEMRSDEYGATAFFDYPGGQEQDRWAAEEVHFLADCSDDDWAVIRNHTELRLYRALYIVASGSLEVVMPRGRRGRASRMATVDAGSVIGEMAFMDGKPRSALVRASTDVQLLRLGFDAFEVLAAKEPVLARTILLDLGRILAHRLRTADAFITAAGT